MTNLTEIENTSNREVKVKLTGGPTIGLPPGSSLNNVDVENLDTIAGNVKVKRNLTEVNGSTGKTRLDD